MKCISEKIFDEEVFIMDSISGSGLYFYMDKRDNSIYIDYVTSYYERIKPSHFRMDGNNLKSLIKNMLNPKLQLLVPIEEDEVKLHKNHCYSLGIDTETLVDPTICIYRNKKRDKSKLVLAMSVTEMQLKELREEFNEWIERLE